MVLSYCATSPQDADQACLAHDDGLEPNQFGFRTLGDCLPVQWRDKGHSAGHSFPKLSLESTIVLSRVQYLHTKVLTIPRTTCINWGKRDEWRISVIFYSPRMVLLIVWDNGKMCYFTLLYFTLPPLYRNCCAVISLGINKSILNREVETITHL